MPVNGCIVVIIREKKQVIDKIKAFFASIHGYVGYVIGGIVAVVGYIFYLRRENTDLTNEVAADKATATLNVTLAKKEELENEANKKTSDYDSIRDAYIKQSSNSDGSPPTGNM